MNLIKRRGASTILPVPLKFVIQASSVQANGSFKATIEACTGEASLSAGHGITLLREQVPVRTKKLVLVERSRSEDVGRTAPRRQPLYEVAWGVVGRPKC